MAKLSLRGKTSSRAALSLDVFEELFRLIWARMAPVLGVLNVRMVLEHALEESRKDHPSLEAVTVGDDGLRLETLRLVLKKNPEQTKEIMAALQRYLANLAQILGRLSGNVVSEQIYVIVERVRQTRKISEAII